MDLKPSHASIPTDPVPINKSRFGIYSSLLDCCQQDSSPSPGMYTRNSSSKSMGSLDDVSRPNGSLDTMKASSPPRKKIIKGSIAQVASTDHDMEDYESWLLGYPSALDSFEKMMSRAKDKKIAIFLEYDGTLAPIYDHPYHAFMSESMRESLKKVARCFPTAIISGRSRDKVFDLVKLTELYYAGSHGMDIMGPVNETYPNCCVKSTDHQGKGITIFQPAREFLPMIDEVFRTLVELSKDIQGAKVENHKFCVSVHYRNVEENNWTTVGQCVHDVLENYPRLHSTHGRKVLEIRPVIDWNKGKAVEFLLESLGLTDRNDVLPIYIGDDQTDEDAFKVLRERNRGCGILISSVSRESNALYSLRDPSEVGELLHLLLNWKEETAIKEAYGKKIN